MLKELNSKRIAIAFSSLLIFINLLPYLLLDSRYMIWDNLDSNHVWYKVLIQSGQLFSSNSTIIDPIMGGLPRSSFPPELSLTTLLYASIGPLGSYVSEKIIKILFAFSGMYLFSRDFLFPNNRYFYVNLSVATLFSILPFWPYGGLSVAGIPLLVYSFLKIRDNCSRGWHWLYIALNPFASSLLFRDCLFSLELFTH